MPDRSRLCTVCVGLACAPVGAHAGPFADRVEEGWYTPAPGQFSNDPLLNDSTKALGPPEGGGLSAGGNTSLVTLGGFGGSIILGFSERVLDDPCNPMGLDAIVFGNAFYISGDPQRRWAEAGIIEIAIDANGNGQPDDQWYVIPGAHLPAAPASAASSQEWDDDPATSTPPANLAWFPSSQSTPLITTGYVLGAPFTSLVLQNASESIESHTGLADLTPTLKLGDTDADDAIDDPNALPAEFYTVPDNPWAVGITPGSAGGDSFDIAWAVHPETGEPARLGGFDFIRISTGPNALAAFFGEISTEVDAVADVAPEPLAFDQNSDGVMNAEDLYHWHAQPVDVDGDSDSDARDGALIEACVRASEPPTATEGR